MLSRRLLRIKVLKALYAYFQTGGGDIGASRRELKNSIDRAYDLYFQILWLPVEVMRHAEKVIERGRKKHLPSPEEHNPNTKFIENALSRRIEQSDLIAEHLKRRKLGWNGYPELIREIYGVMVASDYYKRYMSAGTADFQGDVEVVRDFFASPQLEDSELLEAVLEEQSVLWNDDVGFALVMALKTLDRVRERQNDIPVLPEFKSPDDPIFAERLLVGAAENYTANLALVERFTRNWDIDRIALMDNLILTTAIAELTLFPEIPVKVTLDEYIEIAKYYSTPDSNSFINGVLDKVVETLTAEGRITKEGKGLE